VLLRLPGALPPATVAHWRAALASQPGGSLRLADALALDDVVQVLGSLAPLRAALRQHLGAAPRLLTSQCWVRRRTTGTRTARCTSTSPRCKARRRPTRC
jgi:hypothetical protein